jgi:citrate synthase
LSRRRANNLGQEWWSEILAAIAEAALAEFEKRGKTTLKPNVDFYSASVYHMMGIPNDLMTAVFAVSRIAGWCAHIIEEKFAEAQEKPALYRPTSEYVGNYCGLMGCSYKPLEGRKGHS